MFGKKPIVIFSSSTVCLDHSDEIVFFSLPQWSEGNLDQVIQSIASHIGKKNIDLILADDISYTVLIPFDKNQTIIETEIKKTAQSHIPETLNPGFWDWKYSFKTSTNKFVQVFAANEQKLTLLKSLFAKHHINIASVQSHAYAISQLYQQDENLKIIITEFESKLIVTGSYLGSSILSQITTPELLAKAISFTQHYAEKMFDAKLQEIVLNMADKQLKMDSYKDYKITESSLHLSDSPALKQEIDPEDQTTLLLSPKEKKEKEPEKTTQKEVEKIEKEQTNIDIIKKKSNVLALLGFLLFCSLVLMLTVVWRKSKTATVDPDKYVQKTEIPNTQTTAQNAIASPSGDQLTTPSFDPSVYSIQVLNGSGIAGAASDLQEILIDNGYQDIDIGNADESTYTDTIINSSDADLKENLIEILGQRYTIASDSGLPGDDTYEAQVVIGRGRI